MGICAWDKMVVIFKSKLMTSSAVKVCECCAMLQIRLGL